MTPGRRVLSTTFHSFSLTPYPHFLVITFYFLHYVPQVIEANRWMHPYHSVRFTCIFDAKAKGTGGASCKDEPGVHRAKTNRGCNSPFHSVGRLCIFFAPQGTGGYGSQPLHYDEPGVSASRVKRCGASLIRAKMVHLHTILFHR